MRRLVVAVLAVCCGLLTSVAGAAEPSGSLAVSLRDRIETGPGSGRHHIRTTPETWVPAETAIILCDVWDAHHCLRAVQRGTELAPRLNEVVEELRRRGATVIHAPSDCMPFYAEHPARKRAMETPLSKSLPKEITSWCRQIPAEERVEYPVDQSDGGEDDEPQEHAEWQKTLAAQGRNPRLPWKKQMDAIRIDDAKDYVSDKGDEVWSILEQRGIRNVILAGVHTNMCVLGRPFGLRQLSKNGKHVVLMRDMTDTMYNPARWPYVSHFTGTDRVIEHIEKFVCPTITSDQIIGGTPLRFSKDTRPHVVMVVAEDEYKTEKSLPKFAAERLGRDFRVSFVFGSDQERNEVPGIGLVSQADVLLVSARRRVLHPDAMKVLRDYVAAGKPVVGIRTASHAWSIRTGEPPAGFESWPEWDPQVLGGHYTNHHPVGKASRVSFVAGMAQASLLHGLPETGFESSSSLYRVAPLEAGAVPVLMGEIDGAAAEPVAWTFRRSDGGRSFYTSLGSEADFAADPFRRLLFNGLHWAADREIPASMPEPGPVPDRKT